MLVQWYELYFVHSLFKILIILLSSIYSLVMLLLYTHCLFARAPFPLFIHSLGRFLMTLNLHVRIGCFISLIRCSLRLYASQGPRVSLNLILVFLLLLYSYCFLILCISLSVTIHLLIYLLPCVDTYMWYCSDHDLL